MIYELLENLRKDLSVIEDEIEDLLLYTDIFNELKRKIDISSISDDNPFLNYLVQ